MTLTRLNEIPGLKVGDRVVCTSANGHDDGLPRPWWTVGKTYTVERVDEPYQPRVLDGEGVQAGASSGYFTPAPRETAEERPVTLTEGCLGGTVRDIVRDVWGRCEALEDEAYSKLDQSEKLTDHEIGFWRGQKLAAKSIRRSTEMPTDLTDTVAPNIQLRPETTSEHIARDMAEGRFPAQPERQMVPCTPTPDPADQAELIASLRQVIADMDDKGGEPAADTGWDAEVKSLSFAGRTLQAWTLHDVTVNPEGAFAAINTIANRLAALAAHGKEPT